MQPVSFSPCSLAFAFILYLALQEEPAVAQLALLYLLHFS